MPRPIPSGTLRMATFAALLWDPATSASGYTITFQGLVYDRLVHTAPDGSLVPGLAESWEYSPDGTVLTFHLREGVQFQDGAVFDAAAVKANIERSQTLEGSTLAAELARIAEVVVVDPQTVELHLSSADATLPAVFSGRSGAMISPNSLADPQLDRTPVGAGMFKLVEFAEGSDFAVERWDGYWDPDAVKVKRIEVKVLPDTAVAGQRGARRRGRHRTDRAGGRRRARAGRRRERCASTRRCATSTWRRTWR